MAIVLLILGIIPHDDVARDSVDLMELNHFYDEHGRLVFDQIIFYDWAPYEIPEEIEVSEVGAHAIIKAGKGFRYQVRAWRLVRSPNQIPHKDWREGGYVAYWYDKETLREVRSKSIRETWTQVDPELLERAYLPKEKRRELTQVKHGPVKTSPPSNGP